MPRPTVLRGPLAALLILTAWLLPPGGLAAQPAGSVPVPSLESPRAGSPALAPARRAAGADLLSGASPAWILAGLTGGEAVPGRGIASPYVGDARRADPPSVLDASYAPGGPPDGPEDARDTLGGLGDVLPRELCRDLVELRARIQRYRTVLFGHRGILRWGELEGSDRLGRFRLNLQADPHPGLRVTLITR